MSLAAYVFAVALAAGLLAGAASARRPMLALVLAAGAVPVAVVYATSADADEPFAVFRAVVLAGSALFGWLVGIGIPAMWTAGRRAGERARAHSEAAPL